MTVSSVESGHNTVVLVSCWEGLLHMHFGGRIFQPVICRPTNGDLPHHGEGHGQDEVVLPLGIPDKLAE
jgi:hypothetical protein